MNLKGFCLILALQVLFGTHTPAFALATLSKESMACYEKYNPVALCTLRTTGNCYAKVNAACWVEACYFLLTVCHAASDSEAFARCSQPPSEVQLPWYMCQSPTHPSPLDELFEH